VISLLLLLLLPSNPDIARLEQENALLRIELIQEMKVEMNLRRELANKMFILELEESVQ